MPISDVLNNARSEEAVIKGRSGEGKKSPFGISGIRTKGTMKDIISAVRESRERVAD